MYAHAWTSHNVNIWGSYQYNILKRYCMNQKKVNIVVKLIQ